MIFEQRTRQHLRVPVADLNGIDEYFVLLQKLFYYYTRNLHIVADSACDKMDAKSG